MALDYLVAGLDEVGRGSLAGPIMAVAALFDGDYHQCPIDGIQDSKAFGTGIAGQKARRPIFDKLMASPYLLDFGIGEIGAELIDEKGIHWANQQAFKIAVARLSPQPHYVFVDGMFSVPGLPKDKQWVKPKADRDHWQVGAASIIAKVLRDSLMRDHHLQYPQYGWLTNSGYGCPFHLAALQEFGPSPHHRRSFIKKIMQRGAAHP